MCSCSSFCRSKGLTVGDVQIDAFFGSSQKDAPSVEAEENVAPVEDAAATGIHEEFASLLDDLENLPDAQPTEDTVADAAALEDPSATGSYPPATTAFLAPEPPATSILQHEQHPYSPLLPQDATAGVSEQMPPTPFREAPSRGNRSQMQDEMRHEEDLQTSPLYVPSRPIAFSLGSSIIDSGGQPSQADADQDFARMSPRPTPQATLKDRLLSAKVSTVSVFFRALTNRRPQPPQIPSLSTNERVDSAQLPAQGDATVPALTSLDPAPKSVSQAGQDDFTVHTNRTSTYLPKSPTSRNAKRRRKSNSPIMPSRKKSQSDNSGAQRPPAKKQESNVIASTSPDKAESLNTTGDEQSSSQSHANRGAKSKPKKGVEESDSSLTGLSSEYKSSSPADAKDALGSEEMATRPVESLDALNEEENTEDEVQKDADVETAGSDDGASHEDENANQTPTPSEEEFGDPPSWNFKALEDSGVKKADTPTPTPKKKATNPKGKAKATTTATTATTTKTVTKRGKAASSEPTSKTKPVKKGRVGTNELKDLVSSSVLKGVRKLEDSPRKTRGKRKEEEDAKPNASGAAKKRRQSAGKTGEKAK